MADVVEATLVVALFSMRAPGDHQGHRYSYEGVPIMSTRTLVRL